MMLTLRILAICLLAGAMLWSPAEPHSAGLRPLFSAEPNGVTLNRVSREIGPDGGYQEATDAVFDFAPPYGQADDLEGRRTRQALLWIAANSEQSHRLPWQTWLLEERRNRPEFAAELFLAAQKAGHTDSPPDCHSPILVDPLPHFGPEQKWRTAFARDASSK